MHKSFLLDDIRRILTTAGVLLEAVAGSALSAFFIMLLTGCTCLSPASAGPLSGRKAEAEISLISWNVETFFDAATDGTEYREFTGSKSKWNADKYRDRLERLADYMKTRNADIYCFMEIESEAVVLDISNQLQGSDSRGTKWPYAAFGKEPGSAIGCAVFSRFPLEKLTMHQIDYRASLPASAFESRSPGTRLKPPVMRPLLEVTLQMTRDDTPGFLTLFVCHWKSKSEGEAETAVWRACQEALLTTRMNRALSEGHAVLACGDFNRGLSEFLLSYQPECVELRGFSETVTASSPWFSSTEAGSYFYHGEWNTLDHIFSAGGVTVTSFSTDTEGGLVTEKGTPYGYSVSTGKGWSDHLPLICTFTVSAQ